MIQSFDAFTEGLLERGDLEELSGLSVAIEAAEYLRKKLYTAPTKEPLLPALGGLPFALKKTVLADLAEWKKAGITPVFVFSGLDLGKNAASFEKSEIASQTNRQAWESYGQNDAEGAVKTFGDSGAF